MRLSISAHLASGEAQPANARPAANARPINVARNRGAARPRGEVSRSASRRRCFPAGHAIRAGAKVFFSVIIKFVVAPGRIGDTLFAMSVAHTHAGPLPAGIKIPQALWPWLLPLLWVMLALAFAIQFVASGLGDWPTALWLGALDWIPWIVLAPPILW